MTASARAAAQAAQIETIENVAALISAARDHAAEAKTASRTWIDHRLAMIAADLERVHALTRDTSARLQAGDDEG